MNGMWKSRRGSESGKCEIDFKFDWASQTADRNVQVNEKNR